MLFSFSRPQQFLILLLRRLYFKAKNVAAKTESPPFPVTKRFHRLPPIPPVLPSDMNMGTHLDTCILSGPPQSPQVEAVSKPLEHDHPDSVPRPPPGPTKPPDMVTLGKAFQGSFALTPSGSPRFQYPLFLRPFSSMPSSVTPRNTQESQAALATVVHGGTSGFLFRKH